MGDRSTTSLLGRLEALFKKYDDVPREVVVKEDILREGITPSRAALAHDPRHETYQLFSWDHSRPEEMEEQTAAISLPDILVLEGGQYSLRPVWLRPRIKEMSAYLLDVVDGGLAICDRASGTPMVPVVPFPPEPKCFSKAFDDGTLFREICGLECHIIAFRQCQYWGKQEECKFCDINENARVKMRLGQVKTLQPKKADQVATVIEEYLVNQGIALTSHPYYRTGVRHVHLNGGTVTTSLQGAGEQEFYLHYVDAIKHRIGNRFPICVQTTPWTKEMEQIAYQRGVNVRMSNFEVWDSNLFEVICPGKSSHIGRKEWIRRMLEQVDIFGEGNVCSGFVAGVEMAHPWGFKTVEEAVRSSTEGMEFFMSHGIVVRPISWCVEGLSDLGGQPPPPTDYFIQIDRNWFEIWLKYNLPPHAMFSGVGPGVNSYPNSGAMDMGLL